MGAARCLQSGYRSDHLSLLGVVLTPTAVVDAHVVNIKAYYSKMCCVPPQCLCAHARIRMDGRLGLKQARRACRLWRSEELQRRDRWGARH